VILVHFRQALFVTLFAVPAGQDVIATHVFVDSSKYGVEGVEISHVVHKFFGVVCFFTILNFKQIISSPGQGLNTVVSSNGVLNEVTPLSIDIIV